MIHRIAVLMSLFGCLVIDKARAAETPEPRCPAPEVRFMTLDPGHLHAALVQQEMYDGVSSYADVYAPLDTDLLDHLGRILRFNKRAKNPTAWRLAVHAGPDSLKHMLRERPGNVVVLAGRNRSKIHAIRAAIEAGLSVLADNPLIIRTEDLPLLEAALDQAERRGLVAYDIMTERFEITTVLQRELIHDKQVFGKILSGSVEEPGVIIRSIHYLMTTMDDASAIRPTWFFDVEQQGDGLADVGTQLIDLVPWLLFPEKSIDTQKDIQILDAQRWPTVIPRRSFSRITGVDEFPAFLAKHVRHGSLDFSCNGRVSYVVRGIHVVVSVLWDWEAPTGRETSHSATVNGSRSRIEVRQGQAEGFRREIYVVPNRPRDKPRVFAALRKKLDKKYPGMALEEIGGEIHVTIPDSYRVGHETRFAEATTRFLSYLRDRTAMPAWEKANMLARYFVTTKATELSRRGPSAAAERLAP